MSKNTSPCMYLNFMTHVVFELYSIKISYLGAAKDNCLYSTQGFMCCPFFFFNLKMIHIDCPLICRVFILHTHILKFSYFSDETRLFIRIACLFFSEPTTHTCFLSLAHCASLRQKNELTLHLIFSFF